MKKKLIVSALAAACLSVGVLAGCNSMVSIKSIEKTGTIGLEDYYTITYTDGTTSGFTVTNGKDGEAGKDATEFSVQELYDFYIANGGTGNVEEFIEKFSLSGEAAVSPSAFKSCLLSSMKIYSVFTEGLSREETGYTGSGVIYAMSEEYTYIVTNYHVVYDHKAFGSNKISRKIYAYMYGSESEPVKDNGTYSADDGYAISCEYVGGAITADIAVIRAKTQDVLKINSKARAVEVNTGYAVQDRVYAVGNPSDEGMSVTTGIISVDSEYIALTIDDRLRYYRSLRTDAGLNHGSSGGGLFNEQGQLVGITNSGDTVTVDETEVPLAGKNYAIPASIVKGTADGIIYYYLTEGADYTKNVYLGMTTEEKNSRYVFNEESGSGEIIADIYVTAVEHRAVNGFAPTSAQKIAKNMGLKSGDKLLTLSITKGNETSEYRIKRLFTAKELLMGVRAGDKIKFGYEREGVVYQTNEITVGGTNLFNPDALTITE